MRPRTSRNACGSERRDECYWQFQLQKLGGLIMDKTGIHSLLTLVALSVILLTFVACGDSSTPSEVGTTEDTSPESTPTSTPADRVPDTSPTSLDDYLATCTRATSGPTEDDFTLEKFSAALEEFTEQLDAVNPPEEVADWHAAALVYQRAVKEALDDAPAPERACLRMSTSSA